MLRFVLILLFCLPAYAQNAPSSHTQELKKVETKLKNKQNDLKQLKEKSKTLSGELKETRTNLVGIADKVKNKESELTALEKEIVEQEREKADVKARLEKEKNSVSNLILAIERIERIPPEALILKPGAPYETAQSAMLLQSLLPQIYQRTQQLKKDTALLEGIIADLKNDRKKLKTSKADLDKRYSEIESLLKQRETIFKQTNKTHKARTAEVQQISAQASSLKDLVQKLETDEGRQKAHATKKTAVYRQPTNLPKAGKGQLPASGVITINYGQTDDIGAKSQGIHLKTRKSAIIVSPMAGKVQFAGVFKNYGQLIILQHEKGYHSLIAGMDKIDIVVEQIVKAGEPIGRMQSRTDNGDGPVLYYELRQNGKPINPSKRIVNLKS